MHRVALTAAVLALALSGCGAATSSQNSKFKGEQQNVVKVVDSLAQAGSRGDAEKICTEILAKQLVDELKSAGGDCETEMKAAIEDASDFDLQVRSVKVTGNTATAQVRQGDKGQLHAYSFVKENGDWRATALGG
jgi:hypothetical protein